MISALGIPLLFGFFGDLAAFGFFLESPTDSLGFFLGPFWGVFLLFALSIFGALYSPCKPLAAPPSSRVSKPQHKGARLSGHGVPVPSRRSE